MTAYSSNKCRQEIATKITKGEIKLFLGNILAVLEGWRSIFISMWLLISCGRPRTRSNGRRQGAWERRERRPVKLPPDLPSPLRVSRRAAHHPVVAATTHSPRPTARAYRRRRRANILPVSVGWAKRAHHPRPLRVIVGTARSAPLSALRRLMHPLRAANEPARPCTRGRTAALGHYAGDDGRVIAIDLLQEAAATDGEIVMHFRRM